MDAKFYKGKISFVNHEKHFATIEYYQGAKLKSVNCKTDAPDTNKKPHQFRLGDAVDFELKLSDRGDKMTAYNVRFTHNTFIDLLIQKAAIENRLSGYLKIVDGRYFIKEIDSYILFPLQLSPWEIPPPESVENEIISFKLVNIEKPNAIQAELFSHNYTAAYRKALQHFNNKINAEATVYKVSPHGIYIKLFDGEMQAKLPVEQDADQNPQEGDTINVVITHLTPLRIVVKRFIEDKN